MEVDETKIDSEQKKIIEAEDGLPAKDAPQSRKDNLLDYVINSEEQVQQMLEGETVLHRQVKQRYKVYRFKGAEARLREEVFNALPERVQEMQLSENQDGSPRYTGDDIRNFISAWCANRVTASSGRRIEKDDFWAMVEFVKRIVFDGEDTDDLPKGFIKAEIMREFYEWESFKFKVKVSVDKMAKLRAKIAKKKKRGKKKPVLLAEAESMSVEFLQKAMKLKSNQFVTGSGFANYFKEMHKAIFPPEEVKEK